MESLITDITSNKLNVTLKMRPGSTAAEISLAPGQEFTAEAGAMIAMSPSVHMTTTTHKKSSGGIIKGLKRMLGGESFFLNHYTAGNQGGTVWLGATHAGDMLVKELNGEGIIVQGGSYVASTPDIDIDMSWQGFKSLISKEGLFWLGIRGKGTVVVNSFGAIYPIQVNGEYIVDTGHIVAFEESLNFSLTKAGKSWISSILGGEGLVCKFKGQGTVWIQSHNTTSFGNILGVKLKPRK
ncbi:TIGR00266 family protein [Solitalea longa]|uniref:TIGR00266 family protein n=1 Tax=Solitalea longa TaxID=2079460 RepID=A0A2S5A352_9SPHI|nr:TIGR00266 family protein [Solitalea longa]POY37001.1 TIGR00266 family protein [Solitalea longa]